MSIPNELPPSTTAPELSAYLTRLVVNINTELDNRRFPKISVMPDKPVENKIYFFDNTVAPDITSRGYWVYLNSVWIEIS